MRADDSELHTRSVLQDQEQLGILQTDGDEVLRHSTRLESARPADVLDLTRHTVLRVDVDGIEDGPERLTNLGDVSPSLVRALSG